MGKVKVYIDGREFLAEEGEFLIEVALENGMYIPHLCHHPDLPPTGECGLCIVEIEGVEGFVTSCTFQVKQTVSVRTRSPEINRLRLEALGKLLEGHPLDCSSCPKYLNCELQSLKQYLGYSDNVQKTSIRSFPLNEDNPLFVHDPTRCVLCKRCIRACKDLRGIGILEVKEEKGLKYVYTPSGKPLMEEGCMFCGACVEVCPTGALRDKEEIIKGKRRKEALLPCSSTCPAGVDVPSYLRLIKLKDIEGAWRLLLDKVPFPDVLGYVCNKPCEAVCRRGYLNKPVAIKLLKRFVAERVPSSFEEMPSKFSGKRVAIVGSGPAGLTAAYYLRKRGHEVIVFEAKAKPGGMLRYGIPEWRLPREVLEKTLERIKAIGIRIRTGMKVERLDELKEEFDAVLLALGAQKGVKPKVEGAELKGVYVGIDFLSKANDGEPLPVGEKVVVIGGGSVAIDCARMAKFLGAKEVYVLCVEPYEKMPALPEEIEEAKADGIKLVPSRALLRIIGNSRGYVGGIEHAEVRNFSFDFKGGLQLSLIEGTTEELSVHNVIFAVGQRPEVSEGLGLLVGEKGNLEVDPFEMMTEKEGIFAAGDVLTGTRTVVEAIASGRKVADAIDRYLGSEGLEDRKRANGVSPVIEKIEGFGYLKRIRGGRMDHISEEEATYEAMRCLQCDLRLRIRPPRFWGDLEKKVR